LIFSLLPFARAQRGSIFPLAYCEQPEGIMAQELKVISDFYDFMFYFTQRIEKFPMAAKNRDI